MKHMKTVVIPEKTNQVVDYITCDLCKEKIPKKQSYMVDKVEVSHRVGEHYPEGGYGTDTSVDMCGKCFDEKLIPWLRSQNAEPRTEEYEF
jgi:hypothetical protein